MIQILYDFDLTNYHTFGVSTYASNFVNIESPNQIKELLSHPLNNPKNRLILGGGSNILFTKNFAGLVIHPKIEGIEVLQENSKTVLVRAGSGLPWDKLVEYTVENNWGGLENLTDIPGNVGASPIQNIGAYGTEVREVIERVEAIDIDTGTILTFNNTECEFDYRNSVFKRTYCNKLLITHIVFRLKKIPHKFITHYGNINELLNNYPEKNIQNIRKIIREIRASKLPDYKVNGNAGSFFKNPIVTLKKAEILQQQYTDMPVYPVNKLYVKLSAAWLIDKSGCKGLKFGQATTHIKQPLVIINCGGAKGLEVKQLSMMIQNKVKDVFDIDLETEVNIL